MKPLPKQHSQLRKEQYQHQHKQLNSNKRQEPLKNIRQRNMRRRN